MVIEFDLTLERLGAFREAEPSLRGREPLCQTPGDEIAVAAATALWCEHCVRTHLEGALAQGATLDEVPETIVVAGMIAESSSLAVALREYRKVEARDG